jgi:Sec-independent protein translocase protein TatA
MIGISELGLIIIVILILFKPNDYALIIKTLIKNFNKARLFTAELKNSLLHNYLNDEINRTKDKIFFVNGKKYIYGEDEQLHEVFDLQHKDKNLK